MNAHTSMLRSTSMRRRLLLLSSLLLAPAVLTGCDCGGPDPITGTSLVFTVQPQGMQAGVTFTPAVQVSITDGDGNVDTKSTAQVTLSFKDNPAGGTLGGTLTQAAVDGVATFPDLNVTRAGAGYTLSASSTGLYDAVSTPFDISAGPAVGLAFVQGPSDADVGTVIAPAITVSLADSFGNRTTAASGVTIAIASGPAGAVLGGTATATSVAGLATFPDLTLDLEGTYTLTVTSGSLPAITSPPFVMRPGAPASLAFTAQPSNATAGAPIAPAVQVTLLDARGNVARGSSDPVTISIGANPGGSSLSGTVTRNAVNGVASFPDLSLNKAGIGYTLRAGSGALPQATSSTFNISAGAPSVLAFAVQPSSGASGTAISPPVQVAIEDAYGNRTASTASVTVALGNNPSGATLSGTLTQAAVAGVATLGNLSLDRTGTGYTLTAASAGLTGATSAAFDVTSGPATRLSFTVQPGSTAAGAAITPAVQVSLLDAAGNLVTSSSATVTVALGNNPAGGTLSGVTVVAASGGVATFSSLSLDRAAVGYTLTAASAGLTGATSNAFNVTGGAAAALAFTAQPTNATAGVAISPSVQVSVVDAFGNPTASTASVTVAIGNNPGGGTLGGTATVAAVAGVATFTNLTIDKSGTGYTLTAASAGLTSATSNAFNISAGAPAALAFVQQPTSAASGAAIAPPVTVAIQDAFGNQTNSPALVTMSIGTNPSGGTLSGTLSRAAVAGVATFNDLSINLVGTGYTLNATSPGLAGATSSAFNITGGAAVGLRFVQQPTNTVAGSPITPAVRVAVVDALGNTVVTSTASITVVISVNPGGGTLSGTFTQAAVAGIATFNDLSIDRSGNGYRLNALSAPLTQASSNTFNIAAGPASRLAFTVQPANAAPGAPITPAVQVTIQDALGNPIVGSTATVTVAIGTNPGGGTLSGTLSRAAVAGVATFNDLSINLVGNGYTLTAASTGLTGDTSTSFAIVNSGPAAQLAFLTQPHDLVIAEGSAGPVQVSILDAFGNPTNSTATVTLALGNNPGGSNFSGDLVVAAVNGVSTHNILSLNRPGTGYTIVATSPGLTSATSVAFNVTHGTPANLSFTPPEGQQPSSTPANQAIAPAVKVAVFDILGNLCTSYTGAVTLAIGTNPSGGTLSGTVTQNAVGGISTFPDLSINAPGTGYTLVPSATGAGGAPSTAFNITSGTVSLVYTDPPAGGKIRLVRNAASSGSTVVLDLVAAVPLTGYSVGFNLPLDTTRVQGNAGLLTPGTALPPGTADLAAKAVIPATGPLADVLVSGQSQKAAGSGAFPNDSAVPAGAVFYQLRLDLRLTAVPGVVFDGAALGPLFSAGMRDKAGTDVAVSTEFRIGRLVVN